MDQKISAYKHQLLDEVLLDFYNLQKGSFKNKLQQNIAKNRIFKNLHQYPDCQQLEDDSDSDELWSNTQKNKLKAKMYDILRELKKMKDEKFISLTSDITD